jgi:site-specific DNA-methyltransferase (adenine-specific)
MIASLPSKALAVGNVRAAFGVADARSLPLADSSADLVFGSPPYLECRTYGIRAQRKLATWIDFMLACTREGLRVSKGLVLWVVAGQTKKGCYVPGPEALMHEAFRAGIDLWRPCCWHKVDDNGGGSGIPGSGGQWLRADWEYVIAFKRRGALPFADPTFQKIPPKFPPGGAMRNRQPSGTRELQDFRNPTYVNPGNVVRARVGGKHMGDAECHESEAPFPEKLPAFFIQAYVPRGGVVVDPFSGSGTTVCEAIRFGRNGIGFDIRESQAELGHRRLSRRIAEGRAVLC